jgi:hypothetical protein
VSDAAENQYKDNAEGPMAPPFYITTELKPLPSKSPMRRDPVHMSQVGLVLVHYYFFSVFGSRAEALVVDNTRQ